VARLEEVDFKKEFGKYYFPKTGEISVVDIPAMNFAMVDGRGDPNTVPAYRDAIEALYGVSYTAKFTLKFERVADYRVGPLESLWWSSKARAFSLGSREGWKWTAMIMQPDVVSTRAFRDAVARVREKRNPAALSKVRLERFREGRSAQTMYFGPYAKEAPTIERLHAFIRARKGRLRGKHHEIYLSDPRRTAPERLKTVIRQPFVD
jgi:hypothetical protein